MNTTFLVEGRTGEYADRREWIVGAFQSKLNALEHMTMLNNKARQFGVFYLADRPQHIETSVRLRAIERMWKFDPHVSVDYTGVRYDVVEVELMD